MNESTRSRTRTRHPVRMFMSIVVGVMMSYKVFGAEFTVHDLGVEYRCAVDLCFYPPFTEFADDLYFFGELVTGNEQLLRTDGEHIVALSNVFPSLDGSTEFSGYLFFSGSGPNGHGLFFTDGVSVNEVPNIDFAGSLTEYSGKLYFTGKSGDRNGLLAYDGSKVFEVFHEADPIRSVEVEAVYNSELYFGGPGPNGYELYKTDGRSVALVDDINPGLVGSFPEVEAQYAGELYFSAHGPNGRELYKTDGTTTVEVADIFPGPQINDLGDGSSTPLSFVQFAGDLYFSGKTPDGRRLFKTDGTSTVQLSDLALGGGSFEYVEYDGSLYFSAVREFVKTDGTEVVRVTDISTGPTALSPLNFIEYNEELYFSAFAVGEGRSIYKYDGTSVTLVSNVHPIGEFKEFAGHLFFGGQAVGDEYVSLYRTDGVRTTKVMEGIPGPSSFLSADFTQFNGALYYAAKFSDPFEPLRYYRISRVPEPGAILLMMSMVLWPLMHR